MRSTPDAGSADPLPQPEDVAAEPAAPRAGAYARLVAAGIFLSRIFGLIREWAFAHFFGLTLYADAFRAALRIPNFIQNLLGEGTLSASFIPVYAELLHQGRKEDAGRVAAATFALLLALAGGISLLGIFFAPAMVDIVAWGFKGETLQLTIRAVRILFPMTGILVLYTWGLGILNSHRSFFLSYVAPVIWNVAIIATCFVFGGRLTVDRLVIAVSWGALVGGVLQFLVLLPRVLRLEPRLSLRGRALSSPETREIVRNAGPAILGRGAVQISAWIDVMLASNLSQGAVSVISYTMTLFLLPVSLFGMSMAAAELPELSRQRLDAGDAMRLRVNSGLRQIALLAMPATVGYLVLGDVVIAAILQTGRFTASDTAFAWVVLAGFTLGLMASTGTRLFSSTFFALHDTRTPAWTGFMRVALTAAVGWGLMIPLERYFRVAGHPLGALGLTLGAGVAAWAEWGVLQHVLRKRIGRVGAGLPVLARMFAAALLAAVLGRAIVYFLPHLHVRGAMIVRAVVVLGPYGVAYFVLARAFGVEEARTIVQKVLRRLRR
ncbi:MAG TPA: murein biosynthesis integral membrane protein MurJ [Longimicrobiales bacterium]